MHWLVVAQLMRKHLLSFAFDCRKSCKRLDSVEQMNTDADV